MSEPHVFFIFDYRALFEHGVTMEPHIWKKTKSTTNYLSDVNEYPRVMVQSPYSETSVPDVF